MNRIVTEERPEKVSYSYGNLPPSVKEATRRLDEVDMGIARIRGDLGVRTEKDLGTPDAYDDWKFRASRALAHQQREKAFLIQWLSYENGRLERNQDILSEQERRDRLHGMVTEFLKSASKFGTPVDMNGKATIKEIMRRREELSELKMEYGAFLTFLKGESFRIHCPLDYYHSARSRVAYVVQSAEAEIVQLKRLVRSLEPHAPDAIPGSGQQVFDSSPRPNGNPRMFAITAGLHKVKIKLGMSSSDMMVWLYELVIDKKQSLALSPEQLRMLEAMGEYVRLTKERITIEFPR